jgi:hypothetical protein
MAPPRDTHILPATKTVVTRDKAVVGKRMDLMGDLGFGATAWHCL